MSLQALDIRAALDALPAKGKSARPCIVQRILNDLPPDDEDSARFIYATECSDRSDPQHRSGKAMARAFSILGEPVSDSSIADHRRRECTCYR